MGEDRRYIYEILDEEERERRKEEVEKILHPDLRFRDVFDLIDRADEMLEDERYDESYQFLKSIEEELEDIKFEKVLSTISDCREDFEEAEELGLDTDEPRELLTKTKQDLSDDEYKKAFQKAREARVRIAKILNKDYLERYNLEKVEDELNEREYILLKTLELEELIQELLRACKKEKNDG